MEDILGPMHKHDSKAKQTLGQEDSPSVPALKHAQSKYPWEQQLVKRSHHDRSNNRPDSTSICSYLHPMIEILSSKQHKAGIKT